MIRHTMTLCGLDSLSRLIQLSHQLLISQMLCVHNTTEGVSENMGVVTVTVAPLQFIQVPVEVLSADLVDMLQ